MIIDLLQREELFPFLVSGALVVGFLVLEIALMALGLSSLSETDSSGLEAADTDIALAGMSAGEIAADLDISPEMAAQIEAASSEFEAAAPAAQDDLGYEYDSETSLIGTFLDLFGLRNLPLSASLALFSANFASAGLAPQLILHGLFGILIPAGLLVPVAIVAAAVMTRFLSRVIVTLIPKEETSAISERSLGRRRGIVTVGTAKAGRPAEVKIFDGFGNQHYIMAEPLSAKDEIHEGSDVLVLRIRDGGYRLVAVS